MAFFRFSVGKDNRERFMGRRCARTVVSLFVLLVLVLVEVAPSGEVSYQMEEVFVVGKRKFCPQKRQQELYTQDTSLLKRASVCWGAGPF